MCFACFTHFPVRSPDKMELFLFLLLLCKMYISSVYFDCRVGCLLMIKFCRVTVVEKVAPPV